jgi:hypothetical protein
MAGVPPLQQAIAAATPWIRGLGLPACHHSSSYTTLLNSTALVLSLRDFSFCLSVTSVITVMRGMGIVRVSNFMVSIFCYYLSGVFAIANERSRVPNLRPRSRHQYRFPLENPEKDV